MPTGFQSQTAGTNLVKALRKVQASAVAGFNFMTEEINILRKVKEADIPASLREMLFPVDLNESGGVASIPEFGMLARPSITGLEEGLGYLIHLNKRFNRSTLARLVAKGETNQVIDQFKYQSGKAVKALVRRTGTMMWGSSSGVVALTNTDISAGLSQVIQLRALNGVVGLDDFTALTDQFVAQDGAGNEGDGVAILNAGVIVGVGMVTAKSRAAGTITIGFQVAPTVTTADNLQIVFNNAIGNTLAETDFNKALVGWTDALAAASLHSLTHPNWTPALYDTSAVRFSPLLFQRGRDEMRIRGDAKVTHRFWDAAVKRDAWDNRMNTLQRFGDSIEVTLDGDVKDKGITDIVSRNVPPGWVTMFDAAKACQRVQVTPLPEVEGSGGLSPSDGKEYIDQAGQVFEMNLVMGLQWRNRLAIAGYTGKTRS